MNILVSNKQKDLKFSSRAVKTIVRTALDALGVYTDEIHVNFVTKKKICELHEQFFNDPSFTDCITLPIDSPDTQGFNLLGEVFICPKASFLYDDPYKETTLYLVHTLLHLAGYTDTLPSERKKMRAAEKKLMSRLQKKDLLLCPPVV